MKKIILTAVTGLLLLGTSLVANESNYKYSEDYVQGYHDGCKSARTNKKMFLDEEKLSNKNYNLGVKDSYLLCSGTDAPIKN